MNLLKFVSLGFIFLSINLAHAQALTPRTPLFVGTGATNNGSVSDDKQFLGDTTKPFGMTIDAASATPASDFVEIYTGSDVVNNHVVTPDQNFRAGSTVPIGFLSKKPIAGGSQVYVGRAACNNGEATNNTRHKGCNTELLGWTLPVK